MYWAPSDDEASKTQSDAIDCSKSSDCAVRTYIHKRDLFTGIIKKKKWGIVDTFWLIIETTWKRCDRAQLAVIYDGDDEKRDHFGIKCDKLWDNQKLKALCEVSMHFSVIACNLNFHLVLHLINLNYDGLHESSCWNFLMHLF